MRLFDTHPPLSFDDLKDIMATSSKRQLNPMEELVLVPKQLSLEVCFIIYSTSSIPDTLEE